MKQILTAVFVLVKDWICKYAKQHLPAIQLIINDSDVICRLGQIDLLLRNLLLNYKQKEALRLWNRKITNMLPAAESTI